jgi:hypothetical protein
MELKEAEKILREAARLEAARETAFNARRVEEAAQREKQAAERRAKEKASLTRAVQELDRISQELALLQVAEPRVELGFVLNGLKDRIAALRRHKLLRESA